MTKDKNSKRQTRARMKRTGESYTTARAQIGMANAPTVALPTERRHLALE